MRNRDRFRGCLIGGAAGDALGYTVEFKQEGRIFELYGPRGITEYQLKNRIAEISDDTQMTLFTAAGLLRGAARPGGPKPEDFRASYIDWLKTQEQDGPAREGARYSWLANVPGLYSLRAPGNACLAALGSRKLGTVEDPVNDSKGCGGVMRVAPAGLYFNDRNPDVKYVARIAADAAAVTHGHPLGWMPAAMLGQMVHEISQDGIGVAEAAQHAMDTAAEMWPESRHRAYLVRLIGRALELAEDRPDDLEAIHRLGQGWVAEEALAVAVYCAVRYEGDFDRAMIAAVNHKGDSDSTGAVAGNILGAKLGLSGIPEKYTKNLELRDLIIEVADDLYLGCPADENGRFEDPVWNRKYADATYMPRYAAAGQAPGEGP